MTVLEKVGSGQWTFDSVAENNYKKGKLLK